MHVLNVIQSNNYNELYIRNVPNPSLHINPGCMKKAFEIDHQKASKLEHR